MASRCAIRMDESSHVREAPVRRDFDERLRVALGAEPFFGRPRANRTIPTRNASKANPETAKNSGSSAEIGNTLPNSNGGAGTGLGAHKRHGGEDQRGQQKEQRQVPGIGAPARPGSAERRNGGWPRAAAPPTRRPAARRAGTAPCTRRNCGRARWPDRRPADPSVPTAPRSSACAETASSSGESSQTTAQVAHW